MNMRGFVGMIALFSFLLTTTTVYSQINRVKASGTYKTKTIKIGGFDKINLQGSPTVVYTQSADNKSTLEIYGSDNLLNLIECTVSDGTLVVSFKKGVNIEFGRVGRLKIMASSPTLKNVLLQGSGDVILNNKIKSDRLTLTLQGSGDINAGEIVCTDDFSATLQGSGDISVKGSISVGNVALNLSGSGDLNAKDLKAVDVNASVSGSGSISCYVSGTLKCNISGSGDIGYKGSPVNIQSDSKRKPHKL